MPVQVHATHFARPRICQLPSPLDNNNPACVPGAFENTVVALYKYVVPKPKSECSKGEQLGVSFAAGYIAGVFCAIVSHPADNMVRIWGVGERGPAQAVCFVLFCDTILTAAGFVVAVDC